MTKGGGRGFGEVEMNHIFTFYGFTFGDVPVEIEKFVNREYENEWSVGNRQGTEEIKCEYF